MEFDLPSYDAHPQPSKILCIGKNYARHAEEMKSDVPEEPLIFLKPPSALMRTGGEVVLPPSSKDVHHEVEVVVVVGRGGTHIPEEEALEHVAGFAAGLDMTARDLQLKAKEKGHPWAVSKGFDTFAPLGPLVPAGQVSDPQALDVELSVNGVVRQASQTRHMVFSIAQLVAYSSRIFTLEPGDLLYTGTPEGVGPVADGDRLEARVADWPLLQVTVRR